MWIRQPRADRQQGNALGDSEARDVLSVSEDAK